MSEKHWTELPLIGFDTETTGTDPKTARILQAAIITRDPDGVMADGDVVAYVDPGIPIPAESSAIHKITAETLREQNAWPSHSAIPFLLGVITGRAIIRNCPLVIYNAPYDWPLIMEESKRVEGFSYPYFGDPKFLDPLVIDRALDKYRKSSRKLEDVAKFYDVPLGESAHGAPADAEASIGVMRALISRFPELKKYSIDEMQGLQAQWYATWRDGINKFWQGKGIADRITGEWPTGNGAHEA